MTTHSQKKLDDDGADRISQPLQPAADRRAGHATSTSSSPPTTAPRCATCTQRRAAAGRLPAASARPPAQAVPVPALATLRQLRAAADGKEMSTTMAFVRMLGNLLKDPELGPRIVPIVADEARTFGMANLFKQVGIYSQRGPALRAGGHRLGAVATARRWTARSWKKASARPAPSPAGRPRPPATACTAWPMLPFYIYYSMFGFQRVGDAIWAAADQRARGFLLGATSGRTTLGGEGLQHQDGSSHLVAATIPNCKAYDPAFAGELAVIVDRGMREMLVEQQDVFYYVTLMNENYAQPDLPAGVERRRAARLLPLRQLRRRGRAQRPSAQRHPDGLRRDPDRGDQGGAATGGAGHRRATCSASPAGASWRATARPASSARCAGEPAARLRRATAGRQRRARSSPPPTTCAPCRKASAPSCPPAARYLTLGTDGFGRSDTRAALREFFGVDAASIARAAIRALSANRH